MVNDIPIDLKEKFIIPPTMQEFDNYIKEKKIIDLGKANLYALFILLPIAILYFLPFYFLWAEKFQIENIKEVIVASNLDKYGITIGLTIFAIVTLGVVVHELIHGITWSIFAKNGFKSIKFGILLKMLTPYCHCKEPLKVKHYILGAIMPAIILGILPTLISLLTGSISLLLFGYFFTLAAIGDFMIIMLLRKEDSNSYVLDHPSEAGCYIYRKNINS